MNKMEMIEIIVKHDCSCSKVRERMRKYLMRLNKSVIEAKYKNVMEGKREKIIDSTIKL